jgi:hypothetical protein
MKEESLPRDATRAPQLHCFVRDPAASPTAFARYEAIRPVRKGERSLSQQSHGTGRNSWRLWWDVQRFRRSGLLGLIDQRTLPHARGKPTADVFLPRHIQHHIVRLAMAHPFTARELARIVRDGIDGVARRNGHLRGLEAIFADRAADIDCVFHGGGAVGHGRQPPRRGQTDQRDEGTAGPAAPPVARGQGVVGVRFPLSFLGQRGHSAGLGPDRTHQPMADPWLAQKCPRMACKSIGGG